MRDNTATHLVCIVRMYVIAPGENWREVDVGIAQDFAEPIGKIGGAAFGKINIPNALLRRADNEVQLFTLAGKFTF